MADFKIDDRELRQFSKTTKSMPSYFKRVTAEYLNTSAFTHRALNIKSLTAKMTIRDQRFLGMNLKVEKTKAIDIGSQIAISGSITRKGFTGWKEQQEGIKPARKRTTTPKSRGGTMKGKVQSKYRLKPSNKIYKPESFEGKTLQSRFYFMMRVIGSRGGGQFLISDAIKTKRGQLNKGLYTLQGGRVSLLQRDDSNQRARQIKWNSEEWAVIKKKAEENSQKALQYFLERNLIKK